MLTAAELETLAKFHRYSPEDDDHVAARTLPGVHSKGAFFTRGSGHNKLGGYTEIPDEYQEVMDRLLRKHTAAAQGRARARSSARRPTRRSASSRSAAATRRCARRSTVLAERGIAADYMRVRAFPFGDDGRDVPAPRTIAIFVVEQNRDAQLQSLLTLETGGAEGASCSRSWSTAASRCRAGTWSTASRSQLERS